LGSLGNETIIILIIIIHREHLVNCTLLPRTVISDFIPPLKKIHQKMVDMDPEEPSIQILNQINITI